MRENGRGPGTSLYLYNPADSERLNTITRSMGGGKWGTGVFFFFFWILLRRVVVVEKRFADVRATTRRAAHVINRVGGVLPQ